ncbi:unnamed protein product [Symbiodinium sp. CCMP2592]|nr:unnamed protein product [Symbiodinium sp. CCMP2592]
MSADSQAAVEVETRGAAGADEALNKNTDSPIQQSPPSLAKFILNALFTACLNMADFFSDWYVVLQYGCIIDSVVSTGCGEAEELQGCQAHPWWFGIGLFLLIGSDLAQSYLWTFGAFSLMEREWFPFIRRHCGFYYAVPAIGLLLFILFVLALAQVHYLLDIAVVCHLGIPKMEDDQFFARGRQNREIAAKLLESAPQLYLQAYILFAVGSHGDPVKILSVIISVLSLSRGIMETLKKEMGLAVASPIYSVVTGLWLASDQALRAAGFALVLSHSARPYGIAVIASSSLATCVWVVAAEARDRLDLSIIVGVVCFYPWSFFMIYLVPAYFTINHNFWSMVAWPCLIIRWLESAIFALVAFLVARTSCGHVPTSEVAGIFGLLLLNICIYTIRHFCFDRETGKLREFRKGDLQQDSGATDVDVRPSKMLQAEPEASFTGSALQVANVELMDSSCKLRGL